MRLTAVCLGVLIPTLAFAQPTPGQHQPGMMQGRGPAGMMQGQGPAGMTQGQHPPGMMYDHAGHHMSSMAVQPGQAAFAAIQEIVEILEADPATDWSKVNIDALRQHLVDMDNVTLRAEVTNEPIDGGMRFVVSGAGPVRASIQRMVTAHAKIMNGVGNWTFAASNTDNGAVLTVTVPAKDVEQLRGLGFFGVLTWGMHHQAHHLMIAHGEDPHQ